MKILKFLKHNGIYGVGEIAGFDDDRADQLIAAGVAEEYIADAADGDGGNAADTPAPAGKKAAEKASQGDAPAPNPPGDAGQVGDDATKNAGDAAASGAPPAQGKTA